MGALKMLLGLPASRLRAHHPLKYCPDCLQQDQREHLVVYWHLEHQYPGVWTCRQHGRGLVESNLKSTGVERFFWHLPNLRDSFASFERNPASRTGIRKLQELSDLIVCAANMRQGEHIDHARLASSYRIRLKKDGLISETGRLAIRDICARYELLTRELSLVEELRALQQTPIATQAQIRRMLNGPHPNTHPLRHLMFIQTVFGGWNDFWTQYRKASVEGIVKAKSPDMVGSKQPNAVHPQRAELIRLMTEEGLSATRAAQRLGITINTAIVWAIRQGLRVTFRPKNPNVPRKEIIRGLLQGQSHTHVAKTLSISVQVVTRLVQLEVGLSEKWQKARRARLQQRARSMWQAARRRNPALSATQLRKLEPAAYGWLYRNDHAWLEQHKEPQVRRAPARRSSINWVARDDKLVLLINATLIDLLEENNSRRITPQLVRQRIPQLKAKTWALDKLPRTQKILLSLRSTNNRKAIGTLNSSLLMEFGARSKDK